MKLITIPSLKNNGNSHLFTRSPTTILQSKRISVPLSIYLGCNTTQAQLASLIFLRTSYHAAFHLQCPAFSRHLWYWDPFPGAAGDQEARLQQSPDSDDPSAGEGRRIIEGAHWRSSCWYLYECHHAHTHGCYGRGCRGSPQVGCGLCCRVRRWVDHWFREGYRASYRPPPNRDPNIICWIRGTSYSIRI